MSLKTTHIRTKIQLRVLQRTLGSLELDELEPIKVLIHQLNHTLYGNITKRELASSYSFSQRTLARRMKLTQGLIDELEERFGYKKTRKHLSPGEVETIIKYLGTPPKQC